MEKLFSGRLPVLPLKNMVIFPDATQKIEVSRELSCHAILTASKLENKYMLAVCQRDSSKTEITSADLYDVGTVIELKKMSLAMGGNYALRIVGQFRAKVVEYEDTPECIFAEVNELLTVKLGSDDLEDAYCSTIKSNAHRLIALVKASPVSSDEIQSITDLEKLINVLGSSFFPIAKKQKLLETSVLSLKADYILNLLDEEIEINLLRRKIESRVNQSISKGQREFYLREQLKAIHTELGDGENEHDELNEKIKNSDMPEDIKDKVLKEFTKMCRMSTSSPDYNVLRMYIDWMLDVPWSTKQSSDVVLKDAIAILEADHYGLEKIKERIIEYITIYTLNKGKMSQMPILCFVGPPGVGKTSIGISIARALNRKLVRMSLGGMRDESEIRGHRKTYIGAMPGRIIAGLKQAGTNNPVFLLDEVDKLSNDIHGDPSSALLEVLDPSQNTAFRDRYLEVPYDLSNVLFITTANTLDTIPTPLIDRMEIIELGSYTYEEKREIAKRYLIPKKLSLNCFAENDVTFTDDAIDEIISGYTLEAGVRNLERKIDAVCRKIAVKKAMGEDFKRTVELSDVSEYLGARRYEDDKMLSTDEVGVVTGLAWTSVGGTTLNIEAVTVHGKGEILLTGQLGDVMKESARTALSYIHSHASEYDIEEDVFENYDLHIHVPEGATPKDGPSAGITMATAILSVLTGKSVKKSVAMTGEITLTGKVLPIGGLKEKAMAAYRIGIKNVIIPNDNKKDMEELPECVKQAIEFTAVNSAEEVFKLAINW